MKKLNGEQAKINKYKQNGIKLIALVVTIVVLLILAGISISLVVGDNGLIRKSKDAKKQYEEAQANELAMTDEAGDLIDETVTGNLKGTKETKRSKSKVRSTAKSRNSKTAKAREINGAFADR